MRVLLWAFGAAALLLAGPANAGTVTTPAEVGLLVPASVVEPKPQPSSIVARVDLSGQLMTVYVDNALVHTFPVSTGRGRYRTPTGRWNAAWLSPKHRSRKYNNAPMPWSVFFYNGYAVHGTTEIKSLGQPSSHGCVRLHPDNAKTFYTLVKNIGLDNTLIAIVN
jgi:lipoprotein-anchoring transpeptidase ErfK/SrfK